MTYDEIVQALRCCSYGCVCEKCPSRQDENCIDHVNVSAAAAIERLAAENAALREKQRWIPVTERMPSTIPCNAGTEYSEAVIVWTTGNKAMIAVWDGIDFICPTDFWEAWGEEITHWMPLPEVPEEGDT